MKIGDAACVIQGTGMAVGKIGAFVKAGKPIRRVVKRLGLEPKPWTIERGRWDRVILLTDAGYQTPRLQNIVKVTGKAWWEPRGVYRPMESEVIRSKFLRSGGRASVASGCVF